MFQALQSLLGRSKVSVRRRNKQQSRQRSLAVESLEDRKLMAGVTATMEAGGLLRVTGTELANNILVQNQGAATIVYDNGAAIFGVPSLGVNSISIDARGGADNVRVVRVPLQGITDTYQNYLYNQRSIPVTIDGGYGNDVLRGSNQDINTINGGYGNDTIYGGNAADTLRGGFDNDTIYGGAGADKLYGESGRDTLRGGNGNDTLDGSSGDDKLYGEAGNDILNGSFDKDELYGGAGNDTLDGGFGDDLLKGEAGNDILRGSFGNDTLYGGADNDQLYGGYGNDGLFGGRGYDNLYGEAGADRLLTWQTYPSDIAFHSVHNVEAIDAVINFRDTYRSNSATTSGVSGTMTWGAKNWTESEIEAIDKSLAWLHTSTNNTVLLKTSASGAVSFDRYGAYLTPSIAFGSNVAAWNLGSGRMAVTNHGHSLGQQILNEIVVHEIAHNWDSVAENPALWNSWLGVSGWVRRPTSTTPPGTGKSVSGDGGWFHNTSAPFFRTYSKWNPQEDWATTFEAYHRWKNGSLPASEVTRLATKLNMVESFMRSKTTV